MTKHACKNCKTMTTETTCPVCKGTDFTENWKGRIYIHDAAKSEIAKHIGIKDKGEYAIKVR